MSKVDFKRAQLELCVDDAYGLAAALGGGADRVELCSSLLVGGLTPSIGFMRLAKRNKVPAMALIRPREGSFVFSKDEADIMLADIAAAREVGLAGVVLGAANADGTLDVELLARLRDAAGPLDTTLHRVFDLTPDPFLAVDQAVELGFSRILTSGQQKSVPEGLEMLLKLRAHAGARISIMPGGGVTLKNVGEVIRTLGITEVHSSCSTVSEPFDPRLVRFGFAATKMRAFVETQAVGEMRRMLAAIAAPGPEHTDDDEQGQARHPKTTGRASI